MAFIRELSSTDLGKISDKENRTSEISEMSGLRGRDNACIRTHFRWSCLSFVTCLSCVAPGLQGLL